MAFFFGIITIMIQPSIAYAASSEKIPLAQQFEQFPGQEVTGFCYVQVDDNGNLQWRIKVNGLEPETQGHFNLGNWAGEVDVPYTADDDGKADSKNQFVNGTSIRYSLFSQYATCKVHTSGFNEFTSPLIALGVSGSSNEDPYESGKSNQTEKKFFLFYSLEYVLGIFKNNNANADEGNNLILPEQQSPNLTKIENKGIDVFAAFNSLFGPQLPPSNNTPTSDNDTVSIDTKKVDEKQSILITSPRNNVVVAEKIIIKAEVNNSANAVVIFYVDDSPIGTDFQAPYEMVHHSGTMSTGKHPIKVEISSTDISHTISVIKAGKDTDSKTSENKVSEKVNEDKTKDNKPSDTKPSDTNPRDNKPSDTKPRDNKDSRDNSSGNKGNKEKGGGPKK